MIPCEILDHFMSTLYKVFSKVLKLNCVFLRSYLHKMVQNFTGNFARRPSRGLSYQESKVSRVKSKKTKWSTTPFLVKFL